ncbi:hypothetical protein Tco_1368111 [Tanacetum coccineum]
MSGPAESRNKDKFCEFHRDKGHIIDGVVIEQGALQKLCKKWETSGKKKAMTIFHWSNLSKGVNGQKSFKLLHNQRSNSPPTHKQGRTREPNDSAQKEQIWENFGGICDDLGIQEPDKTTNSLEISEGNFPNPEEDKHEIKSQEVHLRCRRRDVLRPYRQHARNQGMPEKSRGTEAERAFQEMKQCIAELSQLTGKNHKKGTNNVSLRGRAIERAFDINYRPRTAIRGQVLADFIAKRPDEDGAQTKVHVKEIIPDPWTLSMDGILMPRRHNDQDSTVDTPFSLPMEMDFVNNPLSRDMDMADADSLSVARTGLFFTQSTPHEYNDEDTLTNNTKFNKPQLRARRFVYCSNEASTQEDGKLSPKWGRTYEVVEHLGQRAYKDPIQGLMTYFVDLEHQRSEELLL